LRRNQCILCNGNRLAGIGFALFLGTLFNAETDGERVGDSLAAMPVKILAGVFENHWDPVVQDVALLPAPAGFPSWTGVGAAAADSHLAGSFTASTL